MDDRELLSRLLEGEPDLGPQTVAEILGRGGEFARELDSMLRNVRLWHTEQRGRIAVFHAVKLLGAMRSRHAVPALIDAIFLAYSTSHEDVMEELPLAFARIGAEAIAPLGSIVEDALLHPTIRSIAASALEGIAVLDRELEDRVLDICREPLTRMGEPGLLRAHLVGLVARFRRPEDQALVSGALSVMPAALDISAEEVETYFTQTTEPAEWAGYRIDPLEFYDNELG